MHENVPRQGRTASRWKSREVFAQRGEWEAIREELPNFVLEDFVAPGFDRANPHFRAVVRQSDVVEEFPVPVAIVGPNYGLVQHVWAGDAVVEAMKAIGVWFDRMPCLLEITELGEWMHCRFVLDESMAIVPPDGNPVHFCIDLYNSVDGKSRLYLQPSWLRLVCDNGLVMRSSKGFGFADVHDRNVELRSAREVLKRAIAAAAEDARKLEEWWSNSLRGSLDLWADGPLLTKWGRHDAARVLHICRTGMDGVPAKFDASPPSQLPVHPADAVPGAPAQASNEYDVAQALSWVAGSKTDLGRRDALIADVPALIGAIRP